MITDQQVTNAAGVQAFNTPSPFTISDLSGVWVVCDVYENDLPSVRMGDTAEITLNAYPDRVFKGKVSNIGAILDPNIRTAKVRIEVQNPGMMRLGMFVKATFRGQTQEMQPLCRHPPSCTCTIAILFSCPHRTGSFAVLEVVSGDLLPDNTSLQEVKSGLQAGATSRYERVGVGPRARAVKLPRAQSADTSHAGSDEVAAYEASKQDRK